MAETENVKEQIAQTLLDLADKCARADIAEDTLSEVLSGLRDMKESLVDDESETLNEDGVTRKRCTVTVEADANILDDERGLRFTRQILRDRALRLVDHQLRDRNARDQQAVVFLPPGHLQGIVGLIMTESAAHEREAMIALVTRMLGDWKAEDRERFLDRLHKDVQDERGPTYSDMMAAREGKVTFTVAGE